MAVEVVESGTWTYGETASMPVHVLRAAYYVLYRNFDPDRFWPDDGPDLTLEGARRVAERRVPSPIRWEPR